jgi:hypothetical protein
MLASGVLRPISARTGAGTRVSKRPRNVATGKFSSEGFHSIAGKRLSPVVGYPLRIQAFARQQMVELIGRIETPGRAPDRNLITVRGKLAGDHCNDGSGPDIHGVMIVFCCFR